MGIYCQKCSCKYWLPAVLIVFSTYGAVAQSLKIPKGVIGVRELFKLVEQQSALTFVYTRTLAGLNQRIRLQSDSYHVADLLKEVGEQAAFSFQWQGNRIIVREQKTGKVEGHVRSSGGKPVPNTTVAVAGRHTETDKTGFYQFDQVVVGRHEISASHVGTSDQRKDIVVIEGKTVVVDFVIASETIVLEDAVVVGKSALKAVKELAFNVDVLNTAALHRNSLDLSAAMDRIAGMRVRATGGLGSDAALSMNGFAGNHVKFFIDGVPLEVFGSTYQINNIPIELAERVEFYKGVAPISLSSDALGGVVNIVTKQHRKSYFEASYSVGSFNTHRTFVNAGYTSPKGFSATVNAYQNYSDNNYWVDVPVVNLETSQYFPGTYRVRRFHDQYRNETLIAKTGLVDRPFADQLYIGLNLGQEHQDSQTGTQMQYVYGERRRKTTTITPFVTYAKTGIAGALDIRATANYNLGYYQFIDTAHRRYNWFGESVPATTPGEYVYSSAKYYNRDGSATLNADYRLNGRQRFSVNHVLTFFNRKAEDPLDVSLESHMLGAPKKSMKNISGLAYQFDYSEDWNASVFVKSYRQTNRGPINTSTGRGRSYEMRQRNYSYVGYGMATTYFWKRLQFKASYEKTYRLPTSDELFGNESYNAGNIELEPESSNNYNLNITLDASANPDHLIELTGGLLFRKTQNYIIRSMGGTPQNPATFDNHGSVNNYGVNGEVKYYYRKWLSVGANVTYQDLKFKDKYDPGDSGDKISTSYNTRVPNVPYFFANGNVGFSFQDVITEGNELNLGYNTLYVKEFPLHVYIKGTQNVAMIPSQFTHNAFIGYHIAGARLELTLEAWNMTDEEVFDNYNLQNPGRRFSAKVRYSISK